jgi:hypothetical protein
MTFRSLRAGLKMMAVGLALLLTTSLTAQIGRARSEHRNGGGHVEGAHARALDFSSEWESRTSLQRLQWTI